MVNIKRHTLYLMQQVEDVAFNDMTEFENELDYEVLEINFDTVTKKLEETRLALEEANNKSIEVPMKNIQKDLNHQLTLFQQITTDHDEEVESLQNKISNLELNVQELTNKLEV